MWNNHVSFVIKMCGDMLISFIETDTKNKLTFKSILSEINGNSTACSFNRFLQTNENWSFVRGIIRKPSWSPYRRPVFESSTKWRHDQCKDVIENSKDLIDIIWQTHSLTNRLSLFQIKINKIKNKKIAVVLVDARTGRDLWLWFSPPFLISICQRSGKVFWYLCYFVNCFLASGFLCSTNSRFKIQTSFIP